MSEHDNPDFFDPVDEINKIISNSERVALPSIYEKVEKLDVVGEGKALVASANARALPTRRVGKFEMLEVLERSLSRTLLNFANPGERAFTALRELSDFVNMATTGSQPKVANAHRDLLPVGHPLSTREHNFSQTELAQFKAEWISADPRIAEEFRPLVASAFIAPASSIEREYVIAKLEATSSTEVPRDIILGLTADGDPYGGGNSFLARSARAKAQRRDRKGRFAYMGGGAKIWLGKQFSARSTLFRFAGYDSKTDSFDLEGLPNTPYQGKVVSVPASKVEAIKAILPELPGLKAPASKSVAKDIIVDPSSLELKDAPTGWSKVSSENGVDTFRSADGWIATRYPNSASAPNEPSITRVRGANVDKSIDPDLPVYHIAKGSNDGLVTDKPFASTQSWGDTQALISRYDKKTNPKPKASLEEQPEEFIEGWTKGEGGYIPGKWNTYTEVSDRAGGKDFYTDPSGRYVAVKLATPPATWQIGAEQYKQTEDERTRKQVLESGLPIEAFDGAQGWDGNVDNLYRLERVKSDGKRELLGFYQDPDDIEKDTEIPLTEDKSQDFYESVIADTLQNGGNTIDFVDGNWPEDGYIVAHEADILKQDGTLGKREELVTPEDFADPIEGPKRLRDFVLKNQDKLNQQGFYLGTWLDTVPVTDENGKVTGEREMVFLDVSEYEADFDKAFDKAEARKEIAIYGVATYDKDGNKGTSLYVADEKRRREVVRKTPVFDKEEARRVSDEADRIVKEEDKWFYENNLEMQRTGLSFWKGGGDDAIPNPELEKNYPEIYRRLKRRFDAEKSRRSVFQNYIRSIFDMSDGMDPGGRNDGLSGESLRTRDNYVGRDRQTLEMNKDLRDGGEVTSKVQKMDTLVKKSKVKDDTQFFRGAWLDPELVKDMGVGDMFFDRAFQSMGLEEATASSYLDFREKDFPNKSRTIFRLLLPKGMNAIHVGDDEVIARRNTKMRIIRKSELDGTTYFDVDVEPQTKEEIDARIQGRVPKPEQSKDATSSSELPANDGGGADGLGNGGPLQINYGPKPTGQGPDSERVTDPNTAIWLSLAKDELGVTLNDIIGESIAINQNNDPEKHLAKRLKKNVAESITDKLRDVNNEEFLEMAVALKMYFRDDLYWDDESLKDISTIPVVYRSEDGNNTYSDTIRGLVMSGPMGNILPQDLIDRLNTERISRKDAKEVVRLMNESGRAPYSDIVFVNKDSEEYMYILREKVASDLVAQWASSSNNGHAMSLAIQDAAFKEFDIDRPAGWRVSDELKDKISEITNSNGNLLRRFLRAQYERTQEYFQKKGISKVTLYRGVKDFNAHDMTKSTFPTSRGFTASIKLRPLSSWSTSEGVAIGFARNEDGQVFRKEYDVKDILAFPGTGVGCYDEKEIVVLGGVTDSVDIADYSPANDPSVVYNSPEPQPITYKQAQPKINISNAPLLLGDFRDLTDEERAEIRRHNPATAIWVPIAEESTFYGKEIPSTLVNVLEQDKEAVRIGKLGGTLIGEEATIGLSRALKSGVAENLTEKLKDISDKEFIDLAMAQGKKEINAGDKSAVESLRYQVVSDLIKSWAVTSNGDEPMSLAVQEIAKKEFGVETASNWDIDPEKQKQVDDIVKNNANLIRKFLRAQYDSTQEYFKRKGITKLSLFRGVKKFDNHEMIEATFPNNGMFTATLGLRPLSSWSTSRNVAEIFANFHQQSRLFRKEFDVKDILCFPGTGFGCLDEKEMVVIGGNTKSIDVSSARLLDPIRGVGQTPFSFEKESENYQIVFKDDKKNPLEEPTEAGRPIGNWVNYAPVDLSKIPPDDGGDEPELDIFELEGVDIYRAEIYKAEVSKNIADSDEMANVENSQFVKLGIQLGDRVAGDIEWGTPTKDINEITLVGFDYRGKLGDTEDLSEILYYQTQDEDQEENNWGYEKGGIGDKIITAYRNNKKLEISKQELAEFLQEYNEVNKYDPFDSYLVQDVDDEYFMSLYREDVVSELVHQWAQTSNDSHAMSLAIQEIASEVFDIKEPSQWILNPTFPSKERLPEDIAKLKKEQGEILEAFVKAQYRLTQEWFEERGIDKISVYRGIKDAKTTVAGEGLVKLRPLSSWSTNISTAIDFTRGKADSPLAKSMVFRREVDVKEIFSTPLTGVGCIEEYEVVLLGGKKMIDSASPTDRDIRMGVWPKAQPQIQVSNAPRPFLSGRDGVTEVDGEAVDVSPEEAKQQMEQAQQAIAQVAQVVPQGVDDLFDPNNPLNIVNARNITNDITGSNENRDNLSKDEILRQKILFMEPTKEWEDLLDQVENAGSPFAKEIVSRVKNKNASLIKDIEKLSAKELEFQIKYEESIKELYDAIGVLVNNKLANPDAVPGLSGTIPPLMSALDDYFINGNPANRSLSDNQIIKSMAMKMVYGDYSTTAQRPIDPKAVADIISQLRAAYSRYPDSADRSRLEKEIQKIYIEGIFGGLNPANDTRAVNFVGRIRNNTSGGNLLAVEAQVLEQKAIRLANSYEKFALSQLSTHTRKVKLAEKIAETTKQVLSENGIEFDHGVTLSANDINWLGAVEMTGGIRTNLTTGVHIPDVAPIPTALANRVAPELKDINGFVGVINKALQSYPKPVALAVKKFLIDNKSSITFSAGLRGATGLINLNNPDVIHDAGSMGPEVLKTMAISGMKEKDAVVTTIHEMVHLIVNGMFRQEMNSVAWAKASRDTNVKDANGVISNNFVDGNNGNVGYTMNGDYLSPQDIQTIITANELGAASSDYAAPYIGKYGNAAASQVGLGQNPFAHGELLSTLLETLLGGGITGLFPTNNSPERIRSGTNPDGSPRYVPMSTGVFSEKLVPFGVSMILLLNQLAKTRLGIA